MTKPQVGLLQCAAEKEYLPVQAQISDTPHLLLLMKRIFFRDTAGGDHHKLKTARDEWSKWRKDLLEKGFVYVRHSKSC